MGMNEGSWRLARYKSKNTDSQCVISGVYDKPAGIYQSLGSISRAASIGISPRSICSINHLTNLGSDLAANALQKDIQRRFDEEEVRICT